MKPKKISNMLLRIFLIAVFFVVAFAIGVNGKKYRNFNNAELVNQIKVPVKTASNIKITGKINIQICTSDTFAVYTNNEDLYGNGVTLTNANDTLIIQSKNKEKSAKVQLKILLPILNTLTISNMAKVNMLNQVSDSLLIEIINAELKIELLEAQELNYKGNSAKLNINSCKLLSNCTLEMSNSWSYINKLQTPILQAKVQNKSTLRFMGLIDNIHAKVDSTSHMTKFCGR